MARYSNRMVVPPLLVQPGVLPSRAAPRAAHSNPAPAAARGWPARSLARVRHSLPQTWFAALHAGAPLRSLSAPARQHPTALAAALLPECCTSHCPAPTGPGTTSAAVHARAATAARATPAPAAPPSLSRRHALQLLPALPTLLPSAAQTTRATATPLQTPHALATSTASPAASARPTQRSCHALPLAACVAHWQIHPTATLRSGCAVSDIPAPLLCRPAPATRAGRSCR